MPPTKPFVSFKHPSHLASLPTNVARKGDLGVRVMHGAHVQPAPLASLENVAYWLQDWPRSINPQRPSSRRAEEVDRHGGVRKRNCSRCGDKGWVRGRSLRSRRPALDAQGRESDGPCRLAMVVALLSRIRVFSFALVPIKRLGIDPSPDHLVDRGDLLPQVWLAKGPVRNLAPYQVIRPLLLGMAARSRTRGPCASARTRRESRQGQRIWRHQHLYASFPID